MRQLILKWNCRKDLHKLVNMSVLEKTDDAGNVWQRVNGCEDMDGGEECKKCMRLAEEHLTEADYI